MLLRIAGINHFDPLGRRKLQDWVARYANNPALAFVATEWDQDIFERVRGQRQRFQQLAARRWPEFSPQLLEILSMSLGYEADSHTQSFPNSEILWLDQGREANPEDINHYAEDRIQLYASFIDDGLDLANEEQMLLAMSERADQRAAGADGIGLRDQAFARLILDRVTHDGWAMVIVGRRHASDSEGSMRRLLEEGRQRCEVALL